jgi:hypothetical protein
MRPSEKSHQRCLNTDNIFTFGNAYEQMLTNDLIDDWLLAASEKQLCTEAIHNDDINKRKGENSSFISIALYKKLQLFIN